MLQFYAVVVNNQDTERTECYYTGVLNVISSNNRKKKNFKQFCFEYILLNTQKN
jgi:hypothetical protein